MAHRFDLKSGGKNVQIGKQKKGGDRWQSMIGKAVLVVPSTLVGIAIGFCLDRVLGSKHLDEGDGSVESDSSSTSRGSKGGRRPVSRGAAMQKIQGTATGPSNSKTTGTASTPPDGSELKMVLVVRLDLKMGSGKIAAQCAHAAVGMYSEILTRNRTLLRRYEECGQPKIVVSCKNQQEMNELRGKAQGAGLPTFTVADAGRTQVAAGSKTVLAIGPGPKGVVDSVTRHLKLL